MQSLRRLLEIVDGGGIAVLATVAAAAGSAPRREGARMVITAAGADTGTVGGGEVEAAALAAAREMLAGGPAVRRLEMPTNCGGMVTVMLERFAPPRRLLVVGAGHVGTALAAAAAAAGYLVAVASPSGGGEAVTGVEAIRADDPSVLERRPEQVSTHVVVATGDAAVDATWAVAALARGYASVGVVGSRKKADAIRRNAAAAGIGAARIASLRCPVGLDLGAVTPAEIAVAIVAELIRLDRAGEVPEAWRRVSRG